MYLVRTKTMRSVLLQPIFLVKFGLRSEEIVTAAAVRQEKHKYGCVFMFFSRTAAAVTSVLGIIIFKF